MSAAALHQRPVATAAASGEDWLALILAAQRDGRTCLPFHLGLDESAFARLLEARYGLGAAHWLAQPAAERDALRQELLALRRDEWLELRALLLAGCAAIDPQAEVMASIVAAACLGGDHLWRDLGLASRAQLHELLHAHFPVLAARNVNHMRWKKFFYKQLCEQDGGYVCRSPSCEQCPTYHDCFGDES